MQCSLSLTAEGVFGRLVPLAVAAVFVAIMTSWQRGTEVVSQSQSLKLKSIF